MPSNEELARRYFEELINESRLDLVDEILAADIVLHFPGRPSPVRGREEFKQLTLGHTNIFPDRRFTIEQTLAWDGWAVVRWTQRATHSGTYLGYPPTGKPVTVTGLSLFRIADGKIAEHWVEGDYLSILRQIGALTPPA
jgi:steroid delta-isomerase-like uncharacterized protein